MTGTQPATAADTVDQACQFISDGDDFLLTSHINNDGDSIGSCLALQGLLGLLGKGAAIIFPDPPNEHFSFLPGWESIATAQTPPPQAPPRLAVLDCPTLERCGAVGKWATASTAILNIDHHQGNDRFGRANLVSTRASSTCELVYQLAKAFAVEIPPAMAAQLYLGILFDTGGFRFSLTTADTLEIAADLVRQGARLDQLADCLFNNKPLAAVQLIGRGINSLQLYFDQRLALMHLDLADMGRGDADEVVNYGMQIRGVEVSVLLKEFEPKRYRVSLRSRDRVDVNAIAAVFGGGGHTNASGCSLDGDLTAVKNALLDAVGPHL